MPNRKQIIIFSVLGITALLIGYFKNPLNLSMGKRAARNLTLEEKELVGTYERYTGSYTSRWVFLDNGIREVYRNGKKGEAEFKWSLVNNELHIKSTNNVVYIYRLNPDNSITFIADIDINGKRKDEPKELQNTFIKIK